MAGQLWSSAADGGYMYADELSKWLRFQLQPLCYFRQLCDPDDQTTKGLHRGASAVWNVYGDVADIGNDLAETEEMPETSFTIAQRSLTVTEYGISVPYTGKLEMLAEHDLKSVIDKTLLLAAQKYFDYKAFTQFDAALYTAAPTSGNSTTAITTTEDGTCATANNLAMGKTHVALMLDFLRENNVPPFRGSYYGAISHPSTWRAFKDDLESIHQYTESGMAHIFEGERGKYEGCKFIDQTFIPKGGAADTTTFDARTGTADAWNNALSSWAFFMGQDTVKEVIVVPEEVRAKIPTDFGRSKAIAVYYLGGFGLSHDDATNTRILKWDSSV